MHTTYDRMLALLEAARDVLPVAQAPVLPDEIGRWVRELPFAEVRAADAAAERYAASLEWPEMPNVVLAQIHLRVEAALDLCEGMRRLQKPPMPFRPDEAMISLLVHYWHNHGPEWVAWHYGGEPPPAPGDPARN